MVFKIKKGLEIPIKGKPDTSIVHEVCIEVYRGSRKGLPWHETNHVGSGK